FTLRNRDICVAPRIIPNFLAERRDRERMREGIELARSIARTPPLRELIEFEATAKIDLFAHVRSYHHGTSTIPMGGDSDPTAVVDGLGTVRGIRGLRVVDASIFPEIPSAPTNLTVIMAAEHIAQKL